MADYACPIETRSAFICANLRRTLPQYFQLLSAPAGAFSVMWFAITVSNCAWFSGV
jgi:hypothetical protein